MMMQAERRYQRPFDRIKRESKPQHGERTICASFEAKGLIHTLTHSEGLTLMRLAGLELMTCARRW